MSRELMWPIDAEDARMILKYALVPRVSGGRCEFGLGHIVFRDGVTKDQLNGCVALLGVFDGFHRGHEALMREALEDAKKFDRPAVAVTFWPDPSEVLGHPQGRLMDARQRADALMFAGAAAVVVLRFDEAFSALSPDGFVDALFQELRPSEIHVGENFRFGYRGLGTTETLRELCVAKGVCVRVRETLKADGLPVSASRIRALFENASLAEAAELMGRYVCLTGTVVHGRGEGTGFGFSTANIEVEKERVSLPRGVFAGYTVVGGQAWPTAANAGLPASFNRGLPEEWDKRGQSPSVPLFGQSNGGATADGEGTAGGGDKSLIESHLLGFSGDIYGESVAFVPLKMLRPERTFATKEELIRTVRGNIEWVAANLGTSALEVEA